MTPESPAVVDHTGLTVADLDTAVAFFRDVLGFVEQRRSHVAGDYAADLLGVPGTDMRTALVTSGGARVEMQEHAGAVGPPGDTHLALRVPDVDAVVAAAAPYGFVPVGAVTTTPSGPAAGTRLVRLSDPAGATLEVIGAART